MSVSSNKTIHDLSPDVIAYIFECAINSTISQLQTGAPSLVDDTELFNSTRSSKITEISTSETPLFFGKICSAWRELAWSTPRLWGTIIILLSQERLASQLDILHQWLERSKSIPLDIMLTFRFGDSNDETIEAASTLEALKLLIPHAEKWRSASLHILDVASLEIINNVRSRLHSLIFLCLRPQGFSMPILDPLDTFQEAPLLCSATIIALPTHLPWIFPWKQLTDLHLIFPQMNDYFNLIRQCSSLCNLRLTNPPPIAFGQDPQYFRLTSPIVHIMLKSLTIESEGYPCLFSDGQFIDMINAVTLPSLQEFHIIMRDSYLEPASFETINSLITRSKCILRSLTIGDTEPAQGSSGNHRADIGATDGSLLCEDANDSDLVRLLRGIPSLTHLHLESLVYMAPRRRMYNQFFTQIHSQILLPNLRAFRFEGPMVFDEEIFLKMVTDRWNISPSQSISRLSHIDLTLAYYEDLSVEMIDAMRQLSIDGLELRLRAGNRTGQFQNVLMGKTLKLDWVGWGYYEAWAGISTWFD